MLHHGQLLRQLYLEFRVLLSALLRAGGRLSRFPGNVGADFSSELAVAAAQGVWSGIGRHALLGTAQHYHRNGARTCPQLVL